MKDYSEFFTQVVANHLHKLVELVGGSRSQKVLVHEWVLGIEYNWRDYVRISDNDDSEFIARLSFWMSGLREQFNSNPSKNKIIKLLDKTFDASTYCYFDYGTRDSIEKQIEKYCKEVDNWFDERILTPKLERFRLSKEVIPLINSNLDTLKEYSIILADSKIEISKNIRNASGLEKEFLSMFKIIVEGYIKSMNDNIREFSGINKYFNSFLESCSRLGYKGLISKKQRSEIEQIKQKVELNNIIIDSNDILRGTLDIDEPKIIKIMNKGSTLSKIQQEVISELSSQIIELLKEEISKFDQYIREVESVEKLWKRHSIDLFNNKQRSEIEEIKSLMEEKNSLKRIISESFNNLKEYKSELPEPEKYSPFLKVFSKDIRPIDSRIVLQSLYSVYMDILKRNPMKGNEIIKKIESFIKKASDSFIVKYLDNEFNKIKELSYLEVRIINIFRRPKKGIEVIIKQKTKKLSKKSTDKEGKSIFEDVPKGRLIVSLNKNNREIEYPLNIEEYYNEKKIWLFSL